MALPYKEPGLSEIKWSESRKISDGPHAWVFLAKVSSYKEPLILKVFKPYSTNRYTRRSSKSGKLYTPFLREYEVYSAILGHPTAKARFSSFTALFHSTIPAEKIRQNIQKHNDDLHVIAKPFLVGEPFPLDHIDMMLEDRRIMDSMGIYIPDINSENYVGARPVDFSASSVLEYDQPPGCEISDQLPQLKLTILQSHGFIEEPQPTSAVIESTWTVLEELRNDSNEGHSDSWHSRGNHKQS